MIEAKQFEFREAIRSVVEGQELTRDQSTAAMDAIMRGEVPTSQIAALVTALRMKGETVDEITGFAEAMRAHALKVESDHVSAPLLDTCGTGGDHSNSFNISTTATFVIAAAGVRIAKHGNRAASSMCGSADLLEGLGVQVELTGAEVSRSIDEVGIGFMFAPAFHPAMRFVGPTRKEIGIRTIFNVLGPLTNPAGAGHQLIGVGHPGIAGKLAEVLEKLGSQRVVLVHSDEGLDEIGITGATAVTEWDRTSGRIREYSIRPMDFGLTAGEASELNGGGVAENVAITRSILSGEKGPRRTVTLMNAGAGIYAAEQADSIAEGISLAAEAIDSGRALERLDALVRTTAAIVADRKVVPA
jgi:anthranilate phosphoribosyltransferase